METKPSGLKLYPNLLSVEEAKEIESLFDSFPVSKENPQMFLMFGEIKRDGCQPALPWMEEWGKEIFLRQGISRVPNQYRFCNWIGELSDQFKWHKDDISLGKEILSISLTNNRKISFRKPGSPGKYELSLKLGDGYLMKGAVRWEWEHRVLPSGHAKGGGKSFLLGYQ